MGPKTTELIRIAKQVRKTITPFYSFAVFVHKKLESIPYYTDTANLIYDLVTSFDEIKDQLMSLFGLETIVFEIYTNIIEPHAVVKEITNQALNLINMSDKILAKTNEKQTKLPTKEELLKVYLSLEEHIVLLIFWFNSYLRHIYN